MGSTEKSHPKFLKHRSNPPIELPEEINKWELFINSRRNGRKLAEEIRDLLNKSETRFGWEWVSFADIREHVKKSNDVTDEWIEAMLKDMQEAHLIEKMAKNDKVSYKDKEGTCFRKRPYYRWAIYAELNQKTDKGYMNAYRRLLTEDRELKKSFDLDEFIKNLPPKLRRGLDQIKLDTGKSDSEIINCILQEKGIKPETVRQIAKQLIDKKQE